MDAAGSLFFVALLGAPTLAAIALLAAHRHGRAHAADYAAIAVPSILFFIVGYARDELRTGWALILWPVLLAAVSMYLLAAKVIVVDRHTVHTNRTSLVLLGALTLGALLLALLVPPLHE